MTEMGNSRKTRVPRNTVVMLLQRWYDRTLVTARDGRLGNGLESRRSMTDRTSVTDMRRVRMTDSSTRGKAVRGSR